MNIKTKTILLYIATLISGIVIGAIGAIQIQKTIITRRIETLQQQKNFVNRMERILRPEERNREELRRLLSRYHRDLRSISEEFRKEVKVKNDSLLQKVRPLLKDKQYRRLEYLLKRKPLWLRNKRHPRDRRERRE